MSYDWTQDCGKSSVSVMKILQSHTKPLINLLALRRDTEAHLCGTCLAEHDYSWVKLQPRKITINKC